MNGWKKIFFTVVSLAILLGHGIENPLAQVTGNLAEMDRLAKQTEDLTAQEDPEGAALAAGKAAMMGDLLTETAREPSSQALFQAASILYRAQERGLRALALFERAGGTPPAPAGVCHFLVQGIEQLRDSKDLIGKHPAITPQEFQNRRGHLLLKIEEWENFLQEMRENLACLRD